MFGTYRAGDVTILLKDITGRVAPQSTDERERQIQSGRHYSEMLPIEYEPSQRYIDAFEYALRAHSRRTAQAVARVAAAIWRDKGRDAVLVSLARAGTPIGVLIRRFIRERYGVDVPHYTISIIRGRGIDLNALDYILARHEASSVQFVDGWTGKGAIGRELTSALRSRPGVSDGLAVLSDPACIATMCGTYEDFLIPSACLNSTVSGLLSRTFLRDDIIGPGDFHGAVFYRELMDRDVTYRFIDGVAAYFPSIDDVEPEPRPAHAGSALEEARDIASAFGIADINLVKPSIGETTRVLLRRVPWKVLVRDPGDRDSLAHILELAKERGVPVERYPLKHYKACGLIKPLERMGDV